MTAPLGHKISDLHIARSAQAGCASVDELQFELSVITCCGKCQAGAQGVRVDCSGQSSHGQLIATAAQQPHAVTLHIR